MSCRRPLASIAFAAAALLALACNEAKTPVEPAAIVTATPTPTVPLSALSGIVRDQSGAPWAGMPIVQCQNASTQAQGSPAGAYTLKNLKPGKSSLNIYAQGQRTPQTLDVDLQPGENTFDPRITVVHGQPATMLGVVTFPVAPPAGVYVECQGKYVAIAGNGAYALTGLESGTWDASVSWNYGDDEFPFVVTLGPGASVVNVTVR